MSTAQHVPAEQRLRLYNVTWQTYEKLLEAFGDRPIRLTYDRGTLDIMTLSWMHERWKRRFGLLIDVLGMELGMDLQGGGSTTFRRAEMERGLESDECYYIQNQPLIRDREEIDLSRDPPPDLAVEVDITNSSLNRMGVYAGLRVPELWRFAEETLRVYRLGSTGEYEACEHSLCFPFLPMAEVQTFLLENQGLSESAFARAFRDWLRARILPIWKAGGNGPGQQP